MSSVTFADIFGAKAAAEYQQYICPKCSKLFIDAVQTNCGHYFCEDCVGEIIYIHKEQARCPLKNCRKKLIKEDGTRYFPDRAMQREIALLQIVCPIHGCGWEGVYKDYQSHQDTQHPPTLLESVPRRRASHVLVALKDQKAIDSFPQRLKEVVGTLLNLASSISLQADSMEKVSEKADYVERISADSLRKLQLEASASSNKSLKCADDFEMFLEARSRTLDASTANGQVYLETAPQVERTTPTAQVSQLPGQLVAGTSCISQQCYPQVLTSDDNLPAGSPPFLPPILNPLSPKLPNPQYCTPYSTTMDASVPCAAKAESASPRNRHRKKPPHLPPLTLKNPTQVTSALSPRFSSSPRVPTLSPYQTSFPTNPLQPLSPNAPSQASPFSTQAQPTNVLYKPAPPIVPPPSILRARNLPVPPFDLPTSPRTKQSMTTLNADCLPCSPRAMPQISSECAKPECIMEKEILAATLEDLIKCKSNSNKENGCVIEKEILAAAFRNLLRCRSKKNIKLGRGRIKSI